MFSTLLLIMSTVATAQTPAAPSGQQAGATSTAKLLDDQILNAVDTKTISNRALVLGLLEINALANSHDVADSVNQRRTELQLGAAPDSPHAVSVLERPGIADLLSLALDRGAIQKSPNGTGLTLSTTPYAIWTGFGGARDTPQQWKRAVVARNLSFSATFSSTEVTNGDFSSFTSGEVKYVIAGNRSPRDPEFLNRIRPQLGENFRVADNLLDTQCKEVLDLTDSAGKEMNLWLKDRKVTKEEVREHLDAVLSKLTVDPVQLKRCGDAVVQGQKTISAGLAAIKDATDAYLKERRNQFSIAGLFVRDATLSDYYAGKLLYARDFQSMSGLSGNLNAEVDWNKNSTTVTGVPLRSLRAYSAELGLTGTYLEGRLDGSISAKGSRDEALDSKSSVIGEAKLNLHLNKTMRLPLSLTYANRETQTLKEGWQFNVGISALMDEVLRRLVPSGSGS